MELVVFLQEIVQQFGLGELTALPQRVSGGYMHRMYKVETLAGVYALKLLNPVIMKRPNAMKNFRRAEKLERILQENGIPVIPALEKDGLKMQCLNGQYYYFFNWCDGSVMEWHEIDLLHCKTAGNLLAKIHRIPCGEGRTYSNQEVRETFGYDKGPVVWNGQESMNREGGAFYGKEGMIYEDWDGYIELAAEACPEMERELAESRNLLWQAQREYNAAVKSAPNVRCICNGDMDSKNVLWKGYEPYVIDLECLDYGNPYTEMFQLALNWSGAAVFEFEYAHFAWFIREYCQVYGEVSVDWKALSGVGYYWLDWLAYNVRRSLGIECCDEEERWLGIREAQKTLRRIRYYASIREEVIDWLVRVVLH